VQAFYNKPELKSQAIAEMQAHIAADQLVKGQYWEDGKGCFIGCAVGEKGVGHWHDTFEELYNIDKRLAKLFDALFEGLPNERSMRWPIEVYTAIQVGADVSKVADEFRYWLLTGEDSPLAFSFKEDAWGVWDAIKGVAALYSERLAGKEPSNAAWVAAANAAYAADAARYAADRCAAKAARYAAGGCAAKTAWAAACAACASWAVEAAARAAGADSGADAVVAAYIKMADKLLELLAAAPTQDKGE
jgi:hypothetical protein